MSTYQTNPSTDERVVSEIAQWKRALRGLAYDLRVGLPATITAFDPATQLCVVQITVQDKLFINNAFVNTSIPPIPDILLMLPGDTNWALTFPSLIGAECYVHFADFCINAWWASGPNLDPTSPKLTPVQEVDRRHDFCDGFAVLAPRSKPNAIPDYSTSELQLRSMDGTVLLGLTETKARLVAPTVELDGNLAISGTPASTAPAYPTFSLPIIIGGVMYYLQLKDVP